MPMPAGSRLHLRAFCPCGHLGQRHADEPPHPCCSPHCDCPGFHIPVRATPPDASWMHAGKPVRRRQSAARYHPSRDSG